MRENRQIVIKSGEKVYMSYDEVCHDLSIRPGSGFVVVTHRGTITFSAGTPDEIRYLFSKVKDKGYKPSKSLVDRMENL